MTEQQQAAIAAEIAKPEYEGLPLVEVARLLCEEPLVDNPVSQDLVPAPLDLDAIIDVVSPASAAKLAQSPGITDFIEQARQNDKKSAVRWLRLGVLAHLITQQEAQQISNLANRTIPDPNWPAKVRAQSKLEQLTGLRSITTEQLAAIKG